MYAVNCVQVLRVGVDVFRYVTVTSAICWLISIDKNIRGRGHKPSDSQVVYFIVENFALSFYYNADCLCFDHNIK